MTEKSVRVEVVHLDEGHWRQIKPEDRATAVLSDRATDIQSAIKQTTVIIQDALADLIQPEGWKISSLQARFGLTLTAETGVIVAKGSAEASFEVTLTIDHL